MQSFVYILATKKQGALYTGVTSDLINRVFQHKEGLTKGFTSRYRIHRLVYYEMFESILDAIAREKCIKKWNRTWKIELIESMNPDWDDLYKDLFG